MADVGVAPGSAGGAGPLTIRARPGQRPVVRLAEHAPPWVFTDGDGARLILDGLYVSGGDIVLRGSFDHVKITGCTLDPGTADPGLGVHGERRAGPRGPRRWPGLPTAGRWRRPGSGWRGRRDLRRERPP